MKISATCSSSRIATRVSWALEEMIISLVMPEAPGGPCRVGRTYLRRTHQQVRQEHRQQRNQNRHGHVEADLQVRLPLIRKTAHPHVENQAERRQGCNHGGAAVTHERKRQSFERREAGRHRSEEHTSELQSR